MCSRVASIERFHEVDRSQVDRSVETECGTRRTRQLQLKALPAFRIVIGTLHRCLDLEAASVESVESVEFLEFLRADAG
jgi:hypothetical protein